MIRKAMFILALGLGFHSEAQILRINNECNPLVTSLQDIVYVVRQEYALKGADGQLYGQNNLEYFGFRYGPAIMWNGKLYMSPTTYFAHRMDSMTGTYGSEYTPVPFRTYSKHFNEQSFTLIDTTVINSNPEKVTASFPNSLCGMQDTESQDSVSKRKTLLITFECRDEVWSDTSRFRLNFLYKDLITDPNNRVKLQTDNLGNSVRFALIFDEVTEVGSAHLEFRGFAEVINGKVQVNLITVDPMEQPEPEKDKKGKRKKR